MKIHRLGGEPDRGKN